MMKDVHRRTHLRLTAMPRIAINDVYTYILYIAVYFIIVEDLNRKRARHETWPNPVTCYT